MRILFSFAGGSGHFIPLIPFARAAAAAGHEAAFAGQAALLPAIGEAGFTGFDTGGASFGDRAERKPLLRYDAAREDRAVRDGYAGRIARERAASILTLCAKWRPDLLVCDEMDFGATVAADRLSLPRARVLVIAAGALARPDLIADPLNALRAAHGLSPDPDLSMLRRDLVVAPFPPAFRDPECPLPATARSFRPGAAPAPAPKASRTGDRPIVYATLGTVFNTESGDLFARLLAGLAALPVELVLTVGPQIDPAAFGPQPDHVRIVRFIDPGALMPHCDLVVSHAGSGTVMGALAHGVPLLLLPMGADQPHNARRCEALGVARALDPVDVTPAALHDAAWTLLTAPEPRAAARRIAADIATLPDPAEAVPLFEGLAAGQRRPSF